MTLFALRLGRRARGLPPADQRPGRRRPRRARHPVDPRPGRTRPAIAARRQGDGRARQWRRPQAAQRIVNELAGKIGSPALAATAGAADPARRRRRTTPCRALANLGFKPAEASAAVAAALEELGDDATLDALVRLALRKAATALGDGLHVLPQQHRLVLERRARRIGRAAARPGVEAHPLRSRCRRTRPTFGKAVGRAERAIARAPR